MTLSKVLSSSSRIMPSDTVNNGNKEKRKVRTFELTSLLSIGKLDEDRVLLHDSLNVLTANANNTLVVLIGHVERDRSGHLLFHQGQTLFHRIIGRCVDIDVEVILAKILEHDLNVA